MSLDLTDLFSGVNDSIGGAVDFGGSVGSLDSGSGGIFDFQNALADVLGNGPNLNAANLGFADAKLQENAANDTVWEILSNPFKPAAQTDIPSTSPKSLSSIFQPLKVLDPWDNTGVYDPGSSELSSDGFNSNFVTDANGHAYQAPGAVKTQNNPYAATSGKVGGNNPWGTIDFAKLLYPTQKQQPANNSGLLIISGIAILLIVLVASRR